MGAPSKKSKLKPNTSNEKHKSMNYEKEKASIRANEKTNENLDKNENEVNIQGNNILQLILEIGEIK